MISTDRHPSPRRPGRGRVSTWTRMVAAGGRPSRSSPRYAPVPEDFLVKDIEPDDLLRAIRVAARGDALLPPPQLAG